MEIFNTNHMSLRDWCSKFKEWPLSAQMITIILPIFTVLVAISIGFYPNFSFIDHHMSALGSSHNNPIGYLFFIIACIITGVLLFPYFYGLKRFRTDDKFYKPIILVGIIATVFNVYYIATWGHDAWIEWITAVSSLLFAALVAYNMKKEDI